MTWKWNEKCKTNKIKLLKTEAKNRKFVEKLSKTFEITQKGSKLGESETKIGNCRKKAHRSNVSKSFKLNL